MKKEAKEILIGSIAAVVIWYAFMFWPGVAEQMATGFKVPLSVFWIGFGAMPPMVALACTPTLALARVRSR